MPARVSTVAYYMCTVEPVYSGHFGISLKCPDYQDVLVSLHVNGYFRPLPSVLIMEVSLF